MNLNEQIIKIRERMKIIFDKIKNPKKYDIETYNDILDYFMYGKRLTYTLFSHINDEIIKNEVPLLYRKIKFIPFQFEYDLKIAKDDVTEEMIKNAIDNDKNKRKIIDEVLSKKTPLEIIQNIPGYESFIKMKYKNNNETIIKFVISLINQTTVVNRAKIKKLKDHLVPCINLGINDVKIYYHGI